MTCIVADVVDEPASADAAPSVVGAASVRPQRRPPDEGSAAERAAALTAGADPDEDADADESQARPRSRTVVRLAGVAVVAAVLAAGGFAAWHWVRQQYFVGGLRSAGRGVPGAAQDLGPLDLATLDHTTGVLVDTLPPADQDSVRAGLVVDNGTEAAAKVEALREAACPGSPAVASGTVGSVSPGPSPAVSPSVSPRVSPTTVLRAQASPSTTTGATPGPATPSSPLAVQPSPSGSPGAAVTCAGAR